jgi:hypothetical protein
MIEVIAEGKEDLDLEMALNQERRNHTNTSTVKREANITREEDLIREKARDRTVTNQAIN